MTDQLGSKHQKTSAWKSHKSGSRSNVNAGASGLHSGDAGIFVTCDKGQEAKCVREMDDILSEYVSTRQDAKTAEEMAGTGLMGDDIEEDIERELRSMKSPSITPRKPYSFVKLDISCVLFIRMSTPLDPVSIVQRICGDTYANATRPRSRYVKRLTPVSCMKNTLGNGLEQLCETVLKPVFGDGNSGKKFAIRPTVRNNDQLNRDSVIKTVANAVEAISGSHSVDLKNYDCLILVEVYRNVCGMSVVGQDFEKFKRFNLSEIYQMAKAEDMASPSEPT